MKSSGRAGKKLNCCKDSKVPGSNLACAPFVVSFSLCFQPQDRLKSYRGEGQGRRGRRGTRIVEKRTRLTTTQVKNHNTHVVCQQDCWRTGGYTLSTHAEDNTRRPSILQDLTANIPLHQYASGIQQHREKSIRKVDFLA